MLGVGGLEEDGGRPGLVGVGEPEPGAAVRPVIAEDEVDDVTSTPGYRPASALVIHAGVTSSQSAGMRAVPVIAAGHYGNLSL